MNLKGVMFIIVLLQMPLVFSLDTGVHTGTKPVEDYGVVMKNQTITFSQNYFNITTFQNITNNGGNSTEFSYNMTEPIQNRNLTGNNSIVGSLWNYSSKDTIITYNGFNDILGSATQPSGGLRFVQLRPEAKAGIWWRAFDLSSNSNKDVAWIVAHFNASNGNTHQHLSFETLDNVSGTPSVNSKLEIDYGSSNNDPDVTVDGSNFVISNLANFSRKSITKFTPNTTFDIYPNRQSNVAIRISNDTSGITFTTVGGAYTSFLDNVNVSNGLDVCISGAGNKCLSNALRVVNGNLNINGSNLNNVNHIFGVSTIDLYPNNQSVIALRVDNSTDNMTLSILGGGNMNFADNITLGSKNDICIEGGNCLSSVSNNGGTFNITYQNFAYNQTYSGSTFNQTYSNFAYNQSNDSGWKKIATNVILSTISDKVGIGTESPSSFTSKFILNTSQVPIMTLIGTHVSSSSNGAFFSMIDVDGDAMSQGDRLGGFSIGGTYDTSGATINSLAISGFAEEGWSALSTPSYLRFDTTKLGTTTRDEKMRLTANGSLGIGTTSPNQKLDVSGGINSTGEIFLNKSIVSIWLYNQTYSGSIFNSTYSNFAYNQTIASGWNKSGNNLFTGDFNSNVGIGTATPTVNLSVKGDVAISGNLTVGNVLSVNGTNLQYGTKGTGSAITTIYFAGRLSGVQESIKFDDDFGGNFVINRLNSPTTNGQRLGLYGAGGYDSSSVTTSATIGFLSAGVWNTTSHPSELSIQVTANNSISSATAIQIGNNAHVSIGGDVNTPNYWLQILRSGGGNSLNASDVLYVDSTNNRVGIGRASSSPTHELNVLGKINVTSLGTATGNFVCSSDTTGGVLSTCLSSRDLKENFVDLIIDDNFWLNYQQLNPLTYTEKSSKMVRIGLVSEDVRVLFPDATYQVDVPIYRTDNVTIQATKLDSEGKITTVSQIETKQTLVDTKTYYGVDPNSINAINIKAIQDLNNQLQTIKKETCERDKSYSWC